MRRLVSTRVRLWLKIAFVATLFWLSYHYSGGGDLTPERLTYVITDYGMYAPIIYICIYVVVTMALVPATPLTLLGGALFGPLFGVLYVVLGATLGAVGAFLLARSIGGTWLQSRTGPIADRLKQYDERLAKNAFLTILILRLIPLFPFNGLNFGLGLSRVPLRSYALATFIGIIPGTVVYVYFGASLASLNLVTSGIAAALVVTLTLLSKYALRRYNQHHENRL